MAHRDIKTAATKHTHAHGDACHAARDGFTHCNTDFTPVGHFIAYANLNIDADSYDDTHAIGHRDFDPDHHLNADAHLIVHTDSDADRYTDSNSDCYGYANSDGHSDAYRNTAALRWQHSAE